MISIRARRLTAVLSVWAITGCRATDNSAQSVMAPKPSTPTPSGPVALVATSMMAVTATIMIVPALGTAPQTPTVIVRDQYGMPMANVPVTFTQLSASGGFVALVQSLSDSTGVVSCGRWTLGTETGRNVLLARARGVNSVQFDAYVVAPDPPGERYDLVARDGMAPRPGDRGWLVLSDDSTFRLTWIFALGTANWYVADNRGTYSRRDASFIFSDPTGYAWANGVLQGSALTFSFDDSADCGFPCTEVEVYSRSQPPLQGVRRTNSGRVAPRQ